jgi:hypothetical protein
MGGFEKAEHEGHLLAFVSPSLEEGVVTKFGASDAARVRSVLCADDLSLHSDQLIFGAALVPRLIGADGDIVVGRLVRGEARNGQSAPWLLDDPTGDDLAEAQAMLNHVVGKMPSGALVVDTAALDQLRANPAKLVQRAFPEADEF